MKIGFLGFGNLAKALYNGLILSGKLDCKDVVVTAKSEQTLNYANSLGITAVKSVKELFELSSVIILAVKPKVFETLIEDLPSSFEGKKIVSVMAMCKIEKLQKVFGKTPILRIMPSLSSATCSDIIGVSDNVEQFGDFIEVLKGAGKLMFLSEDKLEAFTVGASCGLGFAGYLLKQYQTAIENLGFTKEEALEITKVTFLNSASYDDFENLYTKVATKGGATEQGLLAMKEGNLNEIISKGVLKAYDKATGKM